MIWVLVMSLPLQRLHRAAFSTAFTITLKFQFYHNFRYLHYKLNIGDTASVEKLSQSRMRAAYDETQRIVQEESYARMNERMRTDKEAQLVDIWV